jgi:hypothetical protein
MKLLQNPLIKIIGVLVIIYFGLFANKKNPDSLGNRLSMKKVKEHFSDIGEKGKFIVTNVEAAREYAKTHEVKKNVQQEQKSPEPQQEIQPAPNAAPSNSQEVGYDPGSNDVIIGKGDSAVSCGSKVKIVTIVDYQLQGAVEELVVGSKKNWVIEKNIIGMKKGGLRSIIIPLDFETDDKKLKKALSARTTPLHYRVSLIDLKDPKTKSDEACK